MRIEPTGVQLPYLWAYRVGLSCFQGVGGDVLMLVAQAGVTSGVTFAEADCTLCTRKL